MSEEIIPVAHVGERKLLVKPGCTGSPSCAVEMHIERHTKDGLQWQEVHLTVDEARLLRRLIKNAYRTEPE